MDRLTVARLSAGLRNGEFSSEELTRESLVRIEATNPRLNAFITVTGEAALVAARACTIAKLLISSTKVLIVVSGMSMMSMGYGPTKLWPRYTM